MPSRKRGFLLDAIAHRQSRDDASGMSPGPISSGIAAGFASALVVAPRPFGIEILTEPNPQPFHIGFLFPRRGRMVLSAA